MGDRLVVPAVQLLGDSVLLRGPGVLDTLRLVRFGARQVLANDGIAASPAVDALLDALSRAAKQLMSEAGPSDVRPGVDAQSSVAVDHIGSRQAADLLGVTVRHVTRQATALGGRKVGAHWMFERGVVEAACYERRTPHDRTRR